MSDRVTLTAAAEKLGVHKSTLSRWCSKNPALKDDDGLVSVAELKAHRDAMVNPKLRTRGKEDDQVKVATSNTAIPSLNNVRERTETAKAELAELDLLDRLGRTMDRVAVEAALAEVGEKMSRACQQAAKDNSERFANIDDVRAMEVALTKMLDELLADVAKALQVAAGHGDTSDAA